MKDASNRKATGAKAFRLLAIALAALPWLAAQPASGRLVAAFEEYDGSNPETIPTKLSLTGLYTNIASPTRAVTSGIVPFEVNTPLWSDGSHKERFITLPVGVKVTATDTDQYVFPDKTVLVKNFLIDSTHGDTLSKFLIETRFLVVRQSPFGVQVHGFSYKWHRNQTDADLVDPVTGLDTVHKVKLSGAFKGKRWRYPSQADCNTCHSGARSVLGFLTPQLNRPSKANPTINQLQALVTANILAANPLAGKTNTFRWVGLTENGVTPPAGVTLAEWKARSYFASNCSHCHGNGRARTFESSSHDFDFLKPGRKTVFTEPDTAGGYVGKPTNVDVRFPQLVHRGWPESSFVMARMMSRPVEFNGPSMQMPPLATFQPDSVAANIVKDWICSLGSRGAACKAPSLQADDSYWASAPVGIDPHGFRAGGPASPKAYFRGQVLTIPGPIAAAPALFDFRGNKIGMTRLGWGTYRVETPLRPGMYLLKAGKVPAIIAYFH